MPFLLAPELFWRGDGLVCLTFEVCGLWGVVGSETTGLLFISFVSPLAYFPLKWRCPFWVLETFEGFIGGAIACGFIGTNSFILFLYLFSLFLQSFFFLSLFLQLDVDLAYCWWRSCDFSVFLIFSILAVDHHGSSVFWIVNFVGIVISKSLKSQSSILPSLL